MYLTDDSSVKWRVCNSEPHAHGTPPGPPHAATPPDVYIKWVYSAGHGQGAHVTMRGATATAQ